MFEVLDVSPWETADVIEAVGTRRKEWLRDPDGSPWLFKEVRADPVRHGDEDWAEKAAAELGTLLGIPVATTQLAYRNQRRGIISRNFVDSDCSLVHGNELLSADDPHYPQDQRAKNTAGYTVAAIQRALGPYGGPSESTIPEAPAFAWFSGYLVLDAWVNNTDRHHMNWGVLDPIDMIAPSFDHGSCLAFGETDVRRSALIEGGDASIRQWLERGRTRSFEGMPSMVEVALDGLQACPASFSTVWLERLSRITETDITAIINEIPTTGPAGPVMSEASRTLANEILRINRERLIDAAGAH